MTITKGKTAEPAPTADSRPATATCPTAGTAAAAAIEQARDRRCCDAKPRKRTRIGADVVCEALLRQGVDVLFGYPGGVLLPLYDVLGDYPRAPPRPRPPRAGRRPRRRRLCPGHGPGRRLHGHLRPGRDQPRHGHRHGHARLASRWSPSRATCPAR